nr:hypothetical protein [Tanacetum cinerariifolium]
MGVARKVFMGFIGLKFTFMVFKHVLCVSCDGSIDEDEATWDGGYEVLRAASGSDGEAVVRDCGWVMTLAVTVCCWSRGAAAEQSYADADCFILFLNSHPFFEMVGHTIDIITSVLTHREFDSHCSLYNILAKLRLELLDRNATIKDCPVGKIDMYTCFVEFFNFRVPLLKFLLCVLKYYQINLSQLSVIGTANVSHFELICHVLGRMPTVGRSFVLLFHIVICIVLFVASMGLLDFVKSADPFKVKIDERTLAKNEVPLSVETEDMVISSFTKLRNHTNVLSGFNINIIKKPSISLIAEIGLILRHSNMINQVAAKGKIVYPSIPIKLVDHTIVNELEEHAGKKKRKEFVSSSVTPTLEQNVDVQTRRVPEQFVVVSSGSEHGDTDVSLMAKSPQDAEMVTLKAKLEELENDAVEVSELCGRVSELEVGVVAKSEEIVGLNEQNVELLRKSDACISDVRRDMDTDLYPHMLTTIVERIWILGHDIRLAMMKCAQSSECHFSLGKVISLAINKGIQQGLEAGIEHGKNRRSLAQVEAYDPEVENKYVVAVEDFKNVSFFLLDELEALKDSPPALVMSVLTLEGDTDSTPQLRKLQPSLDQVTILVYSESSSSRGSGSISHAMLLSNLHDDLLTLLFWTSLQILRLFIRLFFETEDMVISSFVQPIKLVDHTIVNKLEEHAGKKKRKVLNLDLFRILHRILYLPLSLLHSSRMWMFRRVVPEQFVVVSSGSEHGDTDVSLRAKSPPPYVEAENIDVEFTDRAGASSTPRDNARASTSVPDEGSPADEFFESQSIDSATKKFTESYAVDQQRDAEMVTLKAKLEELENGAVEVSELCGRVSELEVGVVAKSKEIVGLNEQNVELLRKVSTLESIRDELSRQVVKLGADYENLRGKVAGEAKIREEFLSLQDVAARRFEELSAKSDACISDVRRDMDTDLYPHMLTAIVIYLAINKGIQQGLEAGIEHGKNRRSLAQVEAYDPEVKNKYVVAVEDFENVSFFLLDELEALKDSPPALVMSVLTLEGDTDSTHQLRKLQPSLDQVTILVYSESSSSSGSGSISYAMLLSDVIPAICGRAERRGLGPSSSSAADGTAANVHVQDSSLAITNYHISTMTLTDDVVLVTQLHDDLLTLLFWTSLQILRTSRFSSRASSFMAWFIFGTLVRAFLSQPAAICSFHLFVGLWMLGSCKSLFDIQFVVPVFEWVISELLSVFRYDFSWEAKSAYDVIPHKFLDLVSCYRCDWLCFDPLSKIVDSNDKEFDLPLSFWEKGSKNDMRYKTPPIMPYCLDFIFMARAFLTSAGSVPSVSTSTNTCFLKWMKLVDTILLRASAFLFSILGTCSIENFLNPLMSAFAFSSLAIRASNFASMLDELNTNLKACVNSTPYGFVRMSLAPDPFRHDDPSVNRVHGSGIASSTCISMGGPSSSGLSAMTSAKTWPRIDVLSLWDKICLTGWSVMTAIGCAWKYLLNLLKACTKYDRTDRFSGCAEEHSFFRTKGTFLEVKLHVYLPQ